MRKLVVVNNPARWELEMDGIEVISARDYLTDQRFFEGENVKVFNLCKSYKYQSTGYYVSLLAEARRHRAIPDVTTIQDLKSPAIIKVLTDEIDDLIQKSLEGVKTTEFTLSIYFEKNISKKYDALSRRLYHLFMAPLLRAHFIFDKKWILSHIHPISLNEIPESHKPHVIEFARTYFAMKRYNKTKLSKTIYDLAFLINPNEIEPPSDKKAMDNFIHSAESLGFYTELITKDDYGKIGEFDALFIRETTSVNHHTYKFARKALTMGMVVIDDPLSILRCTNKVYLAELLHKAGLPVPKTVILHKHNVREAPKMLGFPCILKEPDSAFSLGVVKATDQHSLDMHLEKLLASSDLIIAQEFLPTAFDWRIGILDKKPIFACKYYMAENHWQIYDWKDNETVSGKFETLHLNKVPEKVIETAIRAANLIGDGLYGVDLKQIGNQIYIIEINDNPSIDSGIEDLVLGDELYHLIMKSFISRIEKSKKL